LAIFSIANKGSAMNIINSYIVKEILKGSGVALIILLTIFNLFTFSDELDDIGRGSYGLSEVFYFVALQSPTVIYELMPASALLGSLFILGSMANNRELIAMRAAGLSLMGIIKATLMAGSILVVFAFAIGEFIAPAAEETGQVMRATAQNNQVLLKAKYGLWLREDNRFINIRHIEDNGDLADVSVYSLDKQRHLTQALHADKATFLGNQQWRLQTIQQSTIALDNMQADTEKQQLWLSSIAPDLLKIVVVNTDNLSLYDLAMYIKFLNNNQQKTRKFELAFWGRVVNPLVIFVMLMVATPFVIGIKRGVSVGSRLLIGVTIGMGFNILDQIIGHIGLIYELNPIIIAFSPSIAVLTLALFALRRAQ
jgi:lipopolysaccharide export system permease protein